jgi:RimJ/RimL family protein N-acetyltransferase
MMEEQRFRLRSGHTVLIRPIRSNDAPALAAAVEQLSEQSRYRRFHSHVPRLNAPMLTYLTDIDHHDHEALVALAPGSGDIVGVARFIRDTTTPDTAELAIVVADAWHRRSLGTLLIRQLTRRAAEVGVDHFTAEILADNTPTLALVHRLGDAELTDHGPTTTARMDNTG